MADPVGEAFVVVRPDLTGFEASLRAAVASAVRTPLRVPIGGNIRSATLAQDALATSTRSATRALSEQAEVMGVNQTNLTRFSRGIAATGLAMFGLRGATLAATSAFLAGAAAITAIGKGVGFASKFASQLGVLQATSGATVSQMEAVSAAAKQMGQDLSLPGVTAIDAAEAMTELVKAGLSVEQAIDATRGSLQLAQAANISFADAVELVASALNAFELSGGRAAEVADVLANAANAAQGSIVDMGIAFQQAAAIGHQVGLSFQDVALFTTELARAGLTGSDAGTSLRTALIRLINPSKQAKEIFKQLGISVRDASGNLRPDFFVNLGAALEGMTKKQRDATLAIIGGQDAVRALSILSRGSVKDLIELRNELAKQGTAANVAGGRMVGLTRAGANLSNTLEGIALSLGQKATPSLVGFAEGLNNLITATAKSPFVTGTLANSVSGLARAFRELGTGVRAIGGPLLSGTFGVLNSITKVLQPTAILATAAAFFTLRRGMRAATEEAKAGILVRLGASFAALRPGLLAVGSTLVGMTASLRDARAGAVLLGESLFGLITPQTAIIAGIAVFAGAMALALSAESATEKATKRLTKALQELDNAVASATQSADALSRAQDLVATDRLAVKTAKLGVTTARNALAASDAAKGTFERIQLENGLAIALNDRHLAEKQLTADQKEVNRQTELSAAAEEKRKAALAATAEATLKLNEQLQEDAVRNTFNTAGAITLTEGLTEARKKLIAQLRDQAQAQKFLLTDEGIENSKRLNALAEIAGRIKDISNLPTLVRLAFDAKDVTQGLKQVEANLRNTGDIAGAEFVHALSLALQGKLLPTLLGPVTSLMNFLKNLFNQGGTDAGAGYATALHASFSARFAEVTAGILAQVQGLTNQVTTLLQNVDIAELQGKSLQQQLAIANEARRRADIAFAKSQDALNRAVAQPGRKGEATARAARDKALAADQAAAARQAGIQAQIDAQDKEAQQAHQKQLDDAKAARDKADQTNQDILTGREARQAIRRSKVEATTSLVDDIQFFKSFHDFLLRQIAFIKRVIHDSRLKTSILRDLNKALVDNDLEQKKTLAEQRQRRADRRRQAFEDRQESLDLDIRIAEDRKNTNAEIAALQRKNANIRKRIRETHATGLALKRWTAEIEDNNARIRDLRKAQKKATDAEKELAFQFLQTQTGFATTLLSNLLPTGTITGRIPALEGGGGKTSTVPGFGERQPDLVGVGLTKGHATGTGPKGATAGQMNSLISIQRHQLALLTRLVGQRTHPEANTQRVTHNEYTYPYPIP